MDSSALFKIGYGLYVVTTNDGVRDNGMICNTVIQAAGTPLRVLLAINKANYSCETIERERRLNVNVLCEDAPFAVFERFGFKSGRAEDKLAGYTFTRSANGLPVLPAEHVNAVFSLKVESSISLSSHMVFICEVEDAKVLSDRATMTYAYYQARVKPKPAAAAAAAASGAEAGAAAAPAKRKWVCKVCGYVYDPAENGGVAFEDLPSDWVCPWCKHPVSDFEPM